MTRVRPSGDPVPTQPVRVQLLHVQDCPNVDELRRRVQNIASRLSVTVALEEIEGLYPSPTLLVNGEDVTGQTLCTGPSCRLDLPTDAQIAVAITSSAAGTPIE